MWSCNVAFMKINCAPTGSYVMAYAAYKYRVLFYWISLKFSLISDWLHWIVIPVVGSSWNILSVCKIFEALITYYYVLKENHIDEYNVSIMINLLKQNVFML